MMSPVRRAAPWLLVGLVLLGAGLGSGLGLSMQPVMSANSRALVVRILATTRRAGSARFTFTAVTRSSNRFLRSTTTGSGVIDFNANAMQATTTTRNVHFESTDSGPIAPDDLG